MKGAFRGVGVVRVRGARTCAARSGAVPVERLLVTPDVRRIFRYRTARLKERFGSPDD